MVVAKALDVARHLIELAAAELEPDHLTPLRLQKLLYYVQGWSLALRDQPMFEEQIQAWTNGPAVSAVWQEFKAYEREPIVNYEESPSSSLSLQDRFFTRLVWEEYKGYSASRLYEKTHNEEPYRQARGDLPLGVPSNREISQQSMKQYFAACKEETPRFDAFDKAPEWDESLPEDFLEAAQKVFAKRASLLKRLA